MKSNSNRSCPWVLCLCGRCSGVVKVRRVKQIPLRGELVSMTPGQYVQYRDAKQQRAWAKA